MIESSVNKLLAIVAVSVMIILPSCEKDENPTDYTPNFTITSHSGNVGGVDIVEFTVVCITDDVNLANIEINAPDGQSYSYAGGLYVKNQQMEIPDTFFRLSGDWSFVIIGFVDGGTYDGASFIANTFVSVQGK